VLTPDIFHHFKGRVFLSQYEAAEELSGTYGSVQTTT
jgi:hypothetical protein